MLHKSPGTVVQGEAAAFGEMGPRGRGTGHGLGRQGHRPRVELRLVEQVVLWARGLAHGVWRGVRLDVDGDAGITPQHGMVCWRAQAQKSRSSEGRAGPGFITKTSHSGCVCCLL